MAVDPRDQNRVPVMLGALSTDGVTPTPVKADPTTHFIETDDNTTGSDLSDPPAIRDANRVTGLMAVSEDDGVTPVPLYVDSDGKLLIDSS